MHLRGTALRAGFSATAAVLLLVGCGGSDDESEATSSGSVTGSSSAPSTSAGPATSAGPTGSTGSAEETATFCSRSASLTESLNTALAQAGNDPSQLAPVLQQAADQYGGVEAPAAIESDWRTLTDGIQQLATAAESVDYAAPDARAQLQAAFGSIAGQLTTAAVNVEAYTAANCAVPAPAS